MGSVGWLEHSGLNHSKEKLGYQLHSYQALSEAQRKQKEDKIEESREELECLETKLTTFKVTKISVKYH